MTTGSTVQGLVPGLVDNLKGQSDLMILHGNPSGIVVPGHEGVSGATIGFDIDNNQIYQNISGANWLKVGSVAY